MTDGPSEAEFVARSYRQGPPFYGLSPRDLAYWRTRIIAARTLFRTKGHSAEGLDDMIECRRHVPALYEAMAAMSLEHLRMWPSDFSGGNEPVIPSIAQDAVNAMRAAREALSKYKEWVAAVAHSQYDSTSAFMARAALLAEAKAATDEALLKIDSVLKHEN